MNRAQDRAQAAEGGSADEPREAVKLKPPSPSDVGDRIRETEVWKSIFRPGSIFRKGYKDTSRDRALATMNNVLYHLHPVKVKRHGLKLTYTFCLGGLSFFLFILLTITGIFLMFFYRPMADIGGAQAYTDMQSISHLGVLRRPGAQPAPMGRPPDGLQRDAAHGARVLHRRLQAAARVQLGGRRDPAVPHAGPVVHRATCCPGTSSRSGRSPWAPRSRRTRRSSPSRRTSCCWAAWWSGPETLLRWYVLHVLALPFVLVIFLAVHFWRIRKDGGISGPL